MGENNSLTSRVYVRRLVLLVWGLSLTLLVACAGAAAPRQNVQAAPNRTSTSTKQPGTAQQSRSMPDDAGTLLAHLNYAKILHLSQGQFVEKVIVADLELTGSKQAVVLIRHAGSGAFLDWYIFAVVNGQPKQVFMRMNLAGGAISVLPEGIILSDEIDANSLVNRGKPNAELVQDLHKEYRWLGHAFGQTTFPGFYPALTRRETISSQDEVLRGRESFLLNPGSTTQQAAQRLFRWTVPARGIAIIQQNRVTATVVVNKTATFFLRRLVRLDNKGVWSVIAVRTGAISITTPPPLGHSTAAVHLAGRANVFEAALQATLIDHTYHSLLQTHFQATSGSGTPGSYNAALPYHLSAPGQETLLLVYSLSARDGAIQEVATAKILLF